MTITPTASGKRTGRLESYLLSVIRGRPGIAALLLRALLRCLAPVYASGLAIYLLPYRAGWRKQCRLPVPVISIGNLTTGGTGKTPITIAVCRMLLAHGLRPAVLSRGYGGESEFGCTVVSDRERLLASADAAGDEPYLLAGALPGVPVLVGKDRRETGRLAIERFSPDVIVLDDALQFWQLDRDIDVVLLNASHPFDNGYTFPAGLLRVPKSHLMRAGAAVITGIEAASHEAVEQTQKLLRAEAPGVPLFRARLAPSAIRSLADEVEYTPPWLSGRRVAALCCIGNPASFEATLAEAGANVLASFSFRDHASVDAGELEDVFRKVANTSAEAIITTEKDASRLSFVGAPVPVLALRVDMCIDGEAEFERTLLEAGGIKAGANVAGHV